MFRIGDCGGSNDVKGYGTSRDTIAGFGFEIWTAVVA